MNLELSLNFYQKISKYLTLKALLRQLKFSDRDPRGPWCFTNDPDLKYEYCEVRKCRLPSNARHERYNRGPIPKEPCECFSRKIFSNKKF